MSTIDIITASFGHFEQHVWDYGSHYYDWLDQSAHVEDSFNFMIEEEDAKREAADRAAAREWWENWLTH